METFAFVEGGLGGSEGQKIMSAGLPHPKSFRTKGDVLIWVLRLNGGILKFLIDFNSS